MTIPLATVNLWAALALLSRVICGGTYFRRTVVLLVLVIALTVVVRMPLPALP